MSGSQVVSAPADAAVAAPASVDRVNRLWYVDLPVALDPGAPPVADAFSDGTWTATWRSIGGLLPPIAFVVGFLAPILWPGMRNVFSESLVFLLIVVATSFLSGTAGVMLLLGYVCGDLSHDLFNRYGYAGYLGRQLAANVVSYMLLGVATVLIPQLARRLASELSSKLNDDSVRNATQVAVSAIAAALLIFLWCQATIVLIRPVFTWAGNSPTTEAVAQVQRKWTWLVAAAVGAVLLRAVAELLARRMAGWALVNSLQERRWSAPERRGALWRRVPLVIRVLIAAAAVTLLLAGTYVNKFDAGLVFVAVVLLKAWRSGVFGGVPAAWFTTVSKVPALIRFAIAPLLGFVAGWMIIRLFWSTGSLRPVMFATFFTVIFFHLLFPGSPSRERTAAMREAS
jgi:hypothetical protein